jgi:7,8-dihydro-6-hydroxymethylpterin dimethyltransferase
MTSPCNLTFPVCFANSSPERSKHLPLATIERMVDALVASEGEPDIMQISGGEPTLRPDFLDVVDLVRSRPIRHVMINTNGLRIAREPDFVARLAERKRGLEIYLQFDSLRRDALMVLRGADLRRIRQDALENLERYGLSTTLVVTVKRGANDDEIGQIVQHALDWRCVSGITFQPVQDAGRNENFDTHRDCQETDIGPSYTTSSIFDHPDAGFRCLAHSAWHLRAGIHVEWTAASGTGSGRPVDCMSHASSFGPAASGSSSKPAANTLLARAYRRQLSPTRD